MKTPAPVGQDIREQDVYMGDMPLMTPKDVHRERHRARRRVARCSPACSSTTAAARPIPRASFLFRLPHHSLSRLVAGL